MPSVQLVSPYPSSGEALRLKGNLHTHTRCSDGGLPIQEMILRYADHGHDFLGISDHDVLADLDGLDPCGMTLVHGCEVSAGGEHILAIGQSGPITPGDRQQVIDDISAAGAFAVMCHPNWEENYDHCTLDRLVTLDGYLGVEILNSSCIPEPGSGYALGKWDLLLTSGRKVWGFANDDAHHPHQTGGGWNVVFAADRSEEAILAALRSGAFYGSTGVTIDAIECDGSTLTVRAADAEAIAVIGEAGQRMACAEAPELTFDAGDKLTRYIRVDCYGRGCRRAWTQPFFLVGGAIDHLRERMDERPVFPVTPVDCAPELAGDLSDPLWEAAEPVTGFLAMPDASQPPVATEVRAIVAEGFLHLGLRCEEPRMDELLITGKSGDLQIWTDDSIEVFIAGEANVRSRWHIMVNAAGAAAALHTDGRVGLPGLEAAAARSETGWTLEIAIPLGETIPAGHARFNVCRNRRPVRSNFVWSWVGRSYHKSECYGEIRLPAQG